MPALAELTPLAILGVALGLAIITTVLIRATLGTLAAVVGKVPYLGDALAGAVRAVSQAILNKLGQAVSGIESAIGWTWHESAKLTEWLGREIYRHSVLAQAVVEILRTVAHELRRVERLAHSVVSTAAGLGHRVKHLEKEWHGIDKKVRELEREVSKGIGHDLRLRIKALEKAEGRLEDTVIPNLRDLANEAEDDARIALGKIEAIPFPASAKTWAEAVAIALPALGLDWLNCRSNPMKNNRNACGLWGDLSQLLGVLATVLAVADFEELVRLMQEAEQGVIAGLEDLLNV